MAADKMKKVCLVLAAIVLSTGAHAQVDRAALVRNLANRVDKWELGRSDGYIYIVDVGGAMTELAEAGEKAWYMKLRAYAVKDLILKDPDNPWADGFVGWRYKSGTPLDASGTAEALRLAQGFLTGYRKFGDPDDLKQSDFLISGYLKHAYTDHGIWLIRNYFNFATRSFASNSYVSGYDADFLSLAGEHNPDAKRAAENTIKLLKTMSTDDGFLEEILQPELLTALPDVPPEFSPNSVRSIFNSCSALDRAALALPAQGRKLLAFAAKAVGTNRGHGVLRPGLPLYWRDGKPAPAPNPRGGVAAYACLTRLAARLKDDSGVRMFEPLLERELKRDGPTVQLFDLAEAISAERIVSEKSRR